MSEKSVAKLVKSGKLQAGMTVNYQNLYKNKNRTAEGNYLSKNTSTSSEYGSETSNEYGSEMSYEYGSVYGSEYGSEYSSEYGNNSENVIRTPAEFNANEINSWSVLSVNEEKGTVKLIADNVTSTKIGFFGAEDYKNSDDTLNQICSALFSFNGIGKARSINWNDLLEVGYAEIDEGEYGIDEGEYGIDDDSMLSMTSGSYYRQIEKDGITTIDDNLIVATEESPVVFGKQNRWYKLKEGKKCRRFI